MSRRLIGPAVAGLLIALSAGSLTAQTMRKVEYRAALDGRGNLRIWNMSGSIRVTGWDKDSVAVSGAVPADQRFGCGGGAAGVKCAVDLAARYDGIEPGSTLMFMVPRRIQLWVKSSSADILVNNFEGDLEAYSVSGRIRVEGRVQTLAVETMAGAVDVPASSVTLRAKTAGGPISITGDVEDAQVRSVTGNIAISHSRVQRGSFESISGNTIWRGTVLPGAGLEFGSHSGTIELRLSPATGGDIAVSTFAGSVKSEFGPATFVRARDLKGRELQVALPGTTDARITIRNFKGSTLLLKQ